MKLKTTAKHSLTRIGRSISSRFYGVTFRAKKYGPDILLIGGILGGAATTGLAIVATKKTIEKKEEGITVKTAVKVWAPVALTGLAATGCVLGAHGMLKRRNAALTAALATTMAEFAEYRERVKSEIGEEAENAIMTVCTVENPSTGDVASEVKPLSPYAMHFCAETSNEFNKVNPEANLYRLRCAQDYIGFLLDQESHKSKNGVYHVFGQELCDYLGFKRDPKMTVIGWIAGKDGKDGRIDLRIQQVGYNDFWIDPNFDGVIIDKI